MTRYRSAIEVTVLRWEISVKLQSSQGLIQLILSIIDHCFNDRPILRERKMYQCDTVCNTWKRVEWPSVSLAPLAFTTIWCVTIQTLIQSHVLWHAFELKPRTRIHNNISQWYRFIRYRTTSHTIKQLRRSERMKRNEQTVYHIWRKCFFFFHLFSFLGHYLSDLWVKSTREKVRKLNK